VHDAITITGKQPINTTIITFFSKLHAFLIEEDGRKAKDG